jgi:hypothetical protein
MQRLMSSALQNAVPCVCRIEPSRAECVIYLSLCSRIARNGLVASVCGLVYLHSRPFERSAITCNQALLLKLHALNKFWVGDKIQWMSNKSYFLSWLDGPPVRQGLLIIEASRSNTDTPHSVGLFWTRDQPVAQTYTWQHTTLTRDRLPFPRRDSSPQSQHASGCRPTP